MRGRVHAGFAIFALAAACGVASCGHRPARVSVPAAPARIGSSETGIASWYGVPYDGRRTSSGEIYDMNRMTAAHRALPFETWVAVTNLTNGKTVEVRITDRGPFVRGRIIDLSQAAARDIDMLRAGTARVRLTVIEPPSEDRLARNTPRPAQPLAPQPRAVPTPAAKPARQTASESSNQTLNQPLNRPLYQPANQAAIRLPDWFAVQAGAFSDRDRAEMLRAQMVEAFTDARVMLAPGDRPLWRVLVGRQMTAEQASELAARVRDQTGMAVVVAEPMTAD